MHSTQGIIRVVPSGAAEGFWLYLECCSELGRYYRYTARSMDTMFVRLMKPAWGTHMTVVRREVSPVCSPRQAAQFYEGIELEFKYYPEPSTNTKHVWLNVVADDLLDLRESLGLSRYPEYPLHVTVGVMPGD